MVDAGWYPDPGGSSSRRWWDGKGWTAHLDPPVEAATPPPSSQYGGGPQYGGGEQYGSGAFGGPQYGGPQYGGPQYVGAPYGSSYGYGPPVATWKGALYGRPPQGPGSLATPGRRLGARFLDGLLLVPVWLVFAGVAIALVAPHAGPMFPPDRPDGTSPTPGILWVYLTLLGVGILVGVVSFLYDAIATARYGRTFGKAWLHIRPLRTDGSPLTSKRAFGRAAFYPLAAQLISWLGLIDCLWCLWDGNRQCLHDKAADTIVVND